MATFLAPLFSSSSPSFFVFFLFFGENLTCFCASSCQVFALRLS
jgi:hypothetical protein